MAPGSQAQSRGRDQRGDIVAHAGCPNLPHYHLQVNAFVIEKGFDEDHLFRLLREVGEETKASES